MYVFGVDIQLNLLLVIIAGLHLVELLLLLLIARKLSRKRRKK